MAINEDFFYTGVECLTFEWAPSAFAEQAFLGYRFFNMRTNQYEVGLISFAYEAAAVDAE